MKLAFSRWSLALFIWGVGAVGLAQDSGTAGPAFHVVAKGDTLTSIAHRYHTTISALKTTNGLTSDTIRIDQRLRLPINKPSVPVPAPPSPPDNDPPPPPVPVAKPVKPGPARNNKSGSKGPKLDDRLEAMTLGDRLRLQVYLDGVGFAPGKVDGVAGEFTTKAVQCWINAGPDRDFDMLLQAAKRAVSQPVQDFVIPAEAESFVGEVPEDLEERAAAKTLPYTSFAEYLAERFHTDEAALVRLNDGMKESAFKVGATVKVPAVRPFRIEIGRVEGAAKERIPGASIRIWHREHQLEVRADDGQVLAVFPITVGTKPEYVRAGAWKIASVIPNPNFVWDDEMLKHGKKGTKQYILPPGPNNPVGVLWLELQPVSGPMAHIGIHGTNDPTHIGRNHSSGCIRLANWDIVRLCRLVGSGAQVVWVPQPGASKVAESGE